jgi:hypothetical protein
MVRLGREAVQAWGQGCLRLPRPPGSKSSSRPNGSYYLIRRDQTIGVRSGVFRERCPVALIRSGLVRPGACAMHERLQSDRPDPIASLIMPGGSSAVSAPKNLPSRPSRPGYLDRFRNAKLHHALIAIFAGRLCIAVADPDRRHLLACSVGCDRGRPTLRTRSPRGAEWPATTVRNIINRDATG